MLGNACERYEKDEGLDGSKDKKMVKFDDMKKIAIEAVLTQPLSTDTSLFVFAKTLL